MDDDEGEEEDDEEEDDDDDEKTFISEEGVSLVWRKKTTRVLLYLSLSLSLSLSLHSYGPVERTTGAALQSGLC